jgi:hypothetical protein
MWERRLRRLHRAATLIIGAQLVVWTVTGVAFSWFDFSVVRSERERRPPPELRAGAAKISAADAIARAPAGRAVAAAELRPLGAGAVWEISFTDGGEPLLVDAGDGRGRAPGDAAEAEAIARAAFAGSAAPAGVDRIVAAADAPDLPRPIFRVRFADARATELFVTPTGRVAAFRNSSWRWFDRLWSLHVLGYVNRDHPSHAAMRVVAALALLAVASGAALFVASRRRRGDA